MCFFIDYCEEELKFHKSIVNGIVNITNLDKAVFTGDTLFNGGCGKFFEGTALEMSQNFEKLTSLPLKTKIFQGHEYSISNYEWALTIEPDNEEIKN